MSDYAYKADAPVPFKHQHAAFLAHRDARAWAHFWNPRTGKSRVTVDTTAYNFELKRLDSAVTIAPSGVHSNWVKNEIPAYCPERVGVESYAYMTSLAGKARQDLALRRLREHTRGLAWLTMSYDALTTEHGARAMADFIGGGPGRNFMLVPDEIHRAKSSPQKCKRSRFVLKLAKRATMTRGLTGTPVADCPFDVYYPVLALDDQFWLQHGFGGYTAFKTHFAEWETGFARGRTHSFQKVREDASGNKCYRNLDQLQAMLAEISDRFEGGDDMPETVYAKRYYEMTPQQARVYAQLRDEFMTEIEGKFVTADLAITRLLRLQQVLCGYVPADEGKEKIVIPGGNPRLATLIDMLQDDPQPTIIWARFAEDVRQIVERLRKDKHRVIRYDGTLKDHEKTPAYQAFQAGEADYFVGNIAMGEGIPLYRANSTIYYNRSFKLTESKQTEDRPKFIGKKDLLGVTDILCRGTVDEGMVDALRSKFDISARVTGDKAREWL